jgi:trehalose synthase-fused probable maltokinase
MAAPGFRKEIFAEVKTSLPAQLPAYLKNQRWFGAKAREFNSVEVIDVVSLQHDGFEALIVFARIEYQGGESDLYSIPLVSASAATPAGDDATPQLNISGEDGAGKVVFADALQNEMFLSAILDAFHGGLVFRGEAGEVRASRTEAFSLQETGAAGSLRPRAIKAEQSNSSIAYGDRLMLKFFRRLEEGVNPDLEVGGFLTGKANYQQTPQLLGALEYRSGAGKRMTQGILQAYVPNQGDAWHYTLKSISTFYEAAAKFANQRPPSAPEDVPESMRESLVKFLDSTELLAKRTAELHLALASDAVDPDFAPEPFDAKFQQSFEISLLQLTQRAFAQLRQAQDGLPEGVAVKAQEVLRREQEILQRFKTTLSQPVHAMRTRIHGDYHLGQVLYTGSDFVIIDFEGEPARPLSQRRLKRSPLQDVAGMLRSFHYAAHVPLLTSAGTAMIAQEKKQSLNAWAAAWAAWVGDRFLREYVAVAEGALYLPPTRQEINSLLQLHILEKAVYELGYELNNRPAWVAIPLEGISKALAS